MKKTAVLYFFLIALISIEIPCIAQNNRRFDKKRNDNVLEEILENNHQVLIFSQFVSHLALIRESLDESGIKYQYLDGQTPIAKRKERVDAFQKGDGDVFLISLKAGGTGLRGPRFSGPA